MMRPSAAVFLLSIALPSSARVEEGPAPSPALSVEETALVETLTRSLIAPCCWTASIAEHGTGQAPVLEAEIRQMVAEGMSREEIVRHYVDTFGPRILVEPPREGFNVLAYWVPWAALAIGALGIIYFVKRRRQDAPPLRIPPGGSNPNRRRVHEELARLDD